VDAAEKFDSIDRDGRRYEGLEAKHGARSAFDPAMILFDQVVQMFRYLEDRSFVCLGSSPPSRISRTARCDAA
jgi:hypothetical protein